MQFSLSITILNNMTENTCPFTILVQIAIIFKSCYILNSYLFYDKWTLKKFKFLNVKLANICFEIVK